MTQSDRSPRRQRERLRQPCNRAATLHRRIAASFGRILRRISRWDAPPSAFASNPAAGNHRLSSSLCLMQTHVESVPAAGMVMPGFDGSVVVVGSNFPIPVVTTS